MDLATKLDPSEVLEHLRQLGYTEITPAQLKAFMNDLKKLIIHEQMMSSSISSSENVSTSLSVMSSCSSQQGDTSYSASSCLTESEETPSSCITESCTSEYQRTYPGKENVNNLKKAWSVSSSDLKPKSSFIRPWNLDSRQHRSARSDPVSLYHHYKTIWEQQKFPGENDHANLRWLIRERMLGQDPHPTTLKTLRPTSKNFRL